VGTEPRGAAPGETRVPPRPLAGRQGDEVPVTVLRPRREGRPAEDSSRPVPPRSLREATARVAARRYQALDGPEPAATARLHVLGRLTAWERIALPLDEGSFVELDRFARGTGRPASGWSIGARIRTAS
jgi:hypothetical protein